MVIKEDGTKWSCQQCLKGHRVSGCNHTERELVFVPKKGRPLSQCNHCRSERKKRSHHVKCGCGEKDHTTKKCIHLRGQEGQANGVENNDLETALSSVPEDDESDEHSCCCHHGEKCKCSKVYSKHDAPRPQDKPAAKPRLSATTSEGHLSHTANGHGLHKAIARNHSSHDVNTAYRVHKPHLPHHPSSRRSVDNLASIETSSKINRTHLAQLAPALEKHSIAESAQVAPASTAETSHRAFSIPIDYMVPSGHEELYASLPEDTTSAVLSGTDGFKNLDDMFGNATGGNWSNFDFAPCSTSETAQPALTYASSNTISEFGEHTPPEENGVGFGDNSMRNDPGNGKRQPNRWSLPPSYWTNLNESTSFFDFSAVDEIKNDAAANPSRPPPQAEGMQQGVNTSLDAQAQQSHLLSYHLLSGPVFVGSDGQQIRPLPFYGQGQSNVGHGFPLLDYTPAVHSNETYDYIQQGQQHGDGSGDENFEASGLAFDAERPQLFFGAPQAGDAFDLGANLSVPVDLSHHFPS